MNKMKLSRRISVVLSILLFVMIFPASASAEVGTAFTYQGQLYVSGAPASGAYDFKFSLYDSESGGTAKGTLNKPLTVTNGYFCTSLDFGSSIYDGTTYWLEIEVGEAGSGTYTMLGNRQALNPSPYAIFAASVADGAVTPAKINADGSSNGQTLISDGTNVAWGNVAPEAIGTTGASNGQILTFDGSKAVWGAISTSPKLYYKNVSGPIALFPSPDPEVPVISVTADLESGQNAKIDYSLGLKYEINSNWYLTYEIRLYRDGTLIKTDEVQKHGASAGTDLDQLAYTYVDTVPSTTKHTYNVRVIVTKAVNITYVNSGRHLCLNIIAF